MTGKIYIQGPNKNNYKDLLSSLPFFLYLIIIIVFKIITFQYTMEESCFHSPYFLSSLIIINGCSWKTNKQT